MSTTLKIYEELITQRGNREIKTMIEVAKLTNENAIKLIDNFNYCNNWHVNSECGAIFEMSGKDLKQFQNVIEFENGITEIELDADDAFYRLELSY